MESYWGDAECQGYVRAVVVKKHSATDDSQLSLKVNEIVIILEQDETGWWGGHKEGKEEKTGWFPGSCVRTLSPTPAGQSVQDGKLANSALESVPSPARQSYKATSPERGTMPEARDRGHSHSAQNSYQELLSENERLKKENRDKAMLEDRLHKMQRKSDDDQKTLQKTIAQMSKLERELRDSDAELQAERKQKAALQKENARLKEEMMQLHQQQMTAANVGTAESQSSQKKMETAQEDRAKHTNDMRAPASSNAPSTLASVSSAAEEGEAPPVGTVKQIREAFERRSMTPQRPERSERERPEREYRSLGNIGSHRDAPLPPSMAGRFVGPVDRRDGDVDFGLSPIRRGVVPTPTSSLARPNASGPVHERTQ